MAALTPQELKQIVIYWNDRKHRDLSRAEWEDFYRLAAAKLMNTQLPPEFNDQAKRRDLIALFFAEKILANARTTNAGDLINAHVLHAHLANFATDVLKEEAKRGIDKAGDNLVVFEDDEQALEMCVAELSEDEQQLLSEAGINLEAAWKTADELLRTLEHGKRMMLRQHTCAEPEEREPLDALAKRLQISSYHYKAKKLGITGQKGGFFKGYEETKLGGWFKKLGAEITRDWERELIVLLNVFCLCAREMMEGVK